VRKGSREPTIRGREICRYNFAFRRKWQGKYYAIKQVAPVIKEEAIDLRSRGISEEQASDLRARLETFAENCDRPEAAIYDQL
jgi:hypothetical protein